MLKRVIVCGTTLVGVSLVFGTSWSVTAAARQGARSLHVAVVNNDGVPVTDLTAADFEVREGGKTAQITSAALATMPMRVALIVADEATGNFQQAMVTLIKPLIAVAEFKLVSVITQPETILDYTNDAERLVAGVEKMGMRGSGQPTTPQLMEAISENVDTVAQPGKRSVVVVMRLGGAAASQLRQEVVRETLRKNNTQLFAFSPPGAGGGGGVPMAYGGAGGQARADYASAESAYRTRNLESVINDGSKQSGGRHVTFSAVSIIPEIEKLAQELLSQYQISYTLPAGAKPSDRVQITTKRRGVKVLAPERVAN
jgi:VWFA-related protein